MSKISEVEVGGVDYVVTPPSCEVVIVSDRWQNKAVQLTQSDNERIGLISANSNVQVIFDDDSAATVINCGVAATAVSEGAITLACDTTPTAAISATIIIMN